MDKGKPFPFLSTQLAWPGWAWMAPNGEQVYLFSDVACVVARDERFELS